MVPGSTFSSPETTTRTRRFRRVPLPEQDIYRLILVYRWLSLIPPTVGMFVANQYQITTLFFYPLAVLWLIWLSANWWVKRRNSKDKDSENNVTAAPPPRISLVIDLLFCAVLIGVNGMWASPYYLYALGPIFGVALFYGLRRSLLIALMFSLGYLSVLGANLFLGLGGDWLVSVSNVTGFVLISLLFGYQTMISLELRRQTELAEKYRLVVEEQNAKFSRANRELEMIKVFSQALQLGADNHSVYTIALRQIATLETVETVAMAILFPRDQPRPASEGLIEEWLALDEAGQLISYQDGAKKKAPITISTADIQAALVGGQNLTLTPLKQFLVAVRDKERPLAILVATPQKGVELPVLPILADQLGRTLSSLSQTRGLAVESERSRLAMDMHDAISQSLFGMAFGLDACVKLLPAAQEDILVKLEDLRTSAFSTLGSVRNIIYDLLEADDDDELPGLSKDFPVLGEGFSAQGAGVGAEVGQASKTANNLAKLIDLLRRHVKNMSLLYPFALSFKVDSLADRNEFDIPHSHINALYRTVQEAMANSARHAAPTQLQLVLSFEPLEKQLKLIISDDGAGFDVAKTISAGYSEPVRHFGLVNMQKRIEGLGGRFEIKSTPLQGTSIFIVTPLFGLNP